MTVAAPLLMGVSAKQKKKSVFIEFGGYGLILAGVIFALSAIYLMLLEVSNAVVANAIFSLILVGLGGALLTANRWKRAKSDELPAPVHNDPLAQYIPDSIKSDPTVKQLLEKVAENPIFASAGGVTVGMLLANEFYGD